ncbi:nucleotide exchange factor GrpE [Crocinitomix catalasitica]|uniref:nucleotide exchange factor GrpE n=1 Tax=Crocinitomix catalasitica TaxID=184607 RepID=UPI0004838E9C|nr:nucleotide exchange factor GrpE [Crocinitomix catalasitica]
MSENNNEEIKDNLDQEETLNEKVGQEEVSEGNTEEVVKEVSPEDKYNELNNKYVRLYSDFDNFRKRTIKEKADIISTANASLMVDLIGVLDDFERAIANNEKVEDIENLKEGFNLIHTKFANLLKNKGLEPMEAKGEVFNADIHEAITNVPVTDEKDKGKVIDVIEKGYNLRGKMLRYAKVVVGQ